MGAAGRPVNMVRPCAGTAWQQMARPGLVLAESGVGELQPGWRVGAPVRGGGAFPCWEMGSSGVCPLERLAQEPWDGQVLQGRDYAPGGATAYGNMHAGESAAHRAAPDQSFSGGKSAGLVV